jgi:hypothetical protein
MAIKFAIVKSKLLHSPTGYVGRVQAGGTVDFAGLVDRVADSQTSVAKSDVLGVLEDYHRVIERLLRDGNTVITPHVRYRVGMRGNFLDEGDGFDDSRHTLLVRLAGGIRLRKALRDARVDKVVIGPPQPQPLTYFDVETGERNQHVTPGGSGRLIGRHLQFDPADAKQGVFFLDASGSATRVASAAWNKSRHLIFNIPALAAGEYTLEVRAILNDNHELRSGKLGAVLTAV